MSNVKILSSFIPANNKIIENDLNGTGTPPEGFHRIRQVSSDIRNIASSLLNGDYGMVTPIIEGGKEYLARVETHYHQPGGDLKPWGNHKGVTIYAKNDEPVLNEGEMFAKNKSSFLDKLDQFLNSELA